MGAPKLLLPLGGRSVIARLLEALRQTGIADVLVVVRSDDDALAAEVRRAGATLVQPELPPADMRSSVELALREIQQHYAPEPEEGWLLIPADHPVVDASLIEALIARWQEETNPILIPTFEGKRGHPAFFRWNLVEQTFALPADAGLNRLVRDHADEVLEVPVATPSILTDLDTPEDYERLLAEFEAS